MAIARHAVSLPPAAASAVSSCAPLRRMKLEASTAAAIATAAGSPCSPISQASTPPRSSTARRLTAAQRTGDGGAGDWAPCCQGAGEAAMTQARKKLNRCASP